MHTLAEHAAAAAYNTPASKPLTAVPGIEATRLAALMPAAA